MIRLNGIDPMFIYSQTPAGPLEVAYVCTFDPATAPGGYSFAAVKDELNRRLPSLVPFRRKLMSVPFGLDHPRWVDDPEFQLDNHLHRTALPPGGGTSELSGMAAEVMGRSLSPDQPPWEMHIVEGLAGGHVGVIAKVHHAAIDGISGTQLLAQLLDISADRSERVDDGEPWGPPALPSAIGRLAEALPSLVTGPIRTIRAAREIGRMSLRLARWALDENETTNPLPIGAPSHFMSPIHSSRAVEFATSELPTLLALKDSLGITLNDVVLGACSGAMRRYLAAHNADEPNQPIAMVPVSVRRASEQDALGNRLSAMFVPLATDCADPLERLLAVAASSHAAKDQERAVGFSAMASSVADALPPALAVPVIRIGSHFGAMRRLRPANLVVSNVPGPGVPLFFAGMRMESVYPIGPVVDGVALNITVQSYLDSLFIGLNACPAAVPDLAELGRYMTEELDIMIRAARIDEHPSGVPMTTPPIGRRHQRAESRREVSSPGQLVLR